MDAVNSAIWNKFRVKRHDTLPFMGWTGTRETLAELLGELGLKEGAEIGVQSGVYSEILCKSIPELHLTCVDPWKEYVGRNGRLVTQASNDEAYQLALTHLSQYNVTFLRDYSVNAAKQISDGSLDFVYIDGLHDFNSCMMDILTWVPKVKRGGIVSGHDYIHEYKVGVVNAVDAYTYGNAISMWYITKENLKSWFWVNW